MPFDLDTVPGSALTAVLVHPHPDFGGDRFNHVIDALYRELPRRGFSAARFDLGSSDPAAARASTVSVMDRVGASPVALVGYSFGADVSLGVDDPRVAGWFAVAPPLRFAGFPVAGDPRPKSLLVPEQDQFSGPARARQLTADWVNTTLSVLDRADHFLNGRAAEVVGAVAGWMAGLLSAPG